MRPAAIESVIGRMHAIDARFGQRTQTAAALGVGTSSSGPSFAEVLHDTATVSTPSAASASTGVQVGADELTIGGVTLASVNPSSVTDPVLQGAVGSDIPFANEFEAAGARYGVPPRLLASLAWVESRYQVDAVSSAGAIGMMQIMPVTAQELGVDPTDPVQAIDGAARLLAAHHVRFGSWDLAMAAYHSGGGAVARAGNQAPPRAAEYVRRIHERLEST
jgi:membrane-bound lytic murein transglycosylase B